MPGCPCCAGLGGEREEHLARLRVIELYVEQGDAVVQAEAAVVDRVKVELCARQAPHSQGDQRCIRGAGDALHPGAVRSNSTMGSAPGAGASSDLKSLGNAERDQARTRRKDSMSRAVQARGISEGRVGVLDGDAVVRHPSLVPAQQAPLLHRRGKGQVRHIG